MIILLPTFAGIALKPEKFDPVFIVSIPCLSLPYQGTIFQCLNIVLTNITRPLILEFN